MKFKSPVEFENLDNSAYVEIYYPPVPETIKWELCIKSVEN